MAAVMSSRPPKMSVYAIIWKKVERQCKRYPRLSWSGLAKVGGIRIDICLEAKLHGRGSWCPKELERLRCRTRVEIVGAYFVQSKLFRAVADKLCGLRAVYFIVRNNRNDGSLAKAAFPNTTVLSHRKALK
jgi:hypothetical protein